MNRDKPLRQIEMSSNFSDSEVKFSPCLVLLKMELLGIHVYSEQSKIRNNITSTSTELDLSKWCMGNVVMTVTVLPLLAILAHVLT